MKKIYFLLIIAFSFTIVSCDKNSDSSNPSNFDQQSALAQNYAFIQDVYGDIFDFLCLASGDSALMASTHANIGDATVSYDSIANRFVFTFPNKSTNGKTGEFTVDLNGDFQENGTVAHISFNNFSVNGNSVQGSNNIINRGKIGGKKTTGITINYTDSVFATIIKGGETINVSAVYDVNWELGDATVVSDDVYLFSGIITGTVNPNKWFKAIVSPTNRILVTPVSVCQYIQSGIINAEMHTLDASNNPKQTNVKIDFGSGCNNLVELTMDDGTILTFPM